MIKLIAALHGRIHFIKHDAKKTVRDIAGVG
jgi:hypothetical protein